MDLLWRQATGQLIPIMITSGPAINATDDGSYRVPQRDLDRVGQRGIRRLARGSA
jgi:hypothetical protein